MRSRRGEGEVADAADASPSGHAYRVAVEVAPGAYIVARLPDLPPGVASAAWFLAAEALTNAAKYAPGADLSLVVAAGQDLHVSIVDEGPGGAELRPGHGLAGMRERLEAFGGTLTVSSPPGGPTSVSARIPLLLNIGES